MRHTFDAVDQNVISIATQHRDANVKFGIVSIVRVSGLLKSLEYITPKGIQL